MKHVDLKIDFFNDLADGWDGMTDPSSADRLKAIVLLAGLHPPASVLDVGCGTGVLVPVLLDAIGNQGQLIAIDPASRMTDHLREKYPDSRVQTRNDLMEACALPDASLNAVICFSCFPHVSDKPRAIANARRMLREGGKLVVAHVSSRNEINAFHAGCSGPVRHDVLPDEEEMRRMIGTADLKIVHFVDEPGRYELAAIKLSA